MIFTAHRKLSDSPLRLGPCSCNVGGGHGKWGPRDQAGAGPEGETNLHRAMAWALSISTLDCISSSKSTQIAHGSFL